jgi:uncharacterized protein (DUF4415 family)
MAKKTTRDPASRPDEDNPEWTKEDFARAACGGSKRPNLLAKATQELMRRGRGRPPKPDRKVNQTLRLDLDVLRHSGRREAGWQARINQVLRENMPRRPR